MSNIDIKGLDKAELLAALYNRSKPQGLGFIHADGNAMTKEQAQKIIEQDGLRFDYLKGRVMKVNLSGDELNPWGYDRDVGGGAAASVVEALRNGTAAPQNEDDLRNGSEEAKVAVNAVMMSINGLLDTGLPGMLAVYDLREIAAGRGDKVFSATIAKLKSLNLLEPNGRVNQTVKNIVLSACKGEGLDMSVGSPIDTSRSALAKPVELQEAKQDPAIIAPSVSTIQPVESSDLSATAKRPTNSSFIQNLASALGVGKKKHDK